MAYPQPGLFIEQTAQHYHVEWDIRPGVDDTELRRAIGAARRAITDVRGPNAVWGFDPELWSRLAPDDAPASVHRFRAVSGVGGTAPTTQHSIWLWVHGNAYEKVWRAVYSANLALASVAALAFEQRAFVAFDNRDPIGFIDGTENPPVDDALLVALFPDGEPGAGGTAVLVQQWVHDLASFDRLSVTRQEGVIGRTKPDSVELADDVMPMTSHVSRNVLTDDGGEERPVFRRNTPFGTVTSVGTFFIGCTNDPPRLDLMLEQMMGATDDGLIDDLTRFSTPVTGSYYFAPSMGSLSMAFGALETDEGESVVGPEQRSGGTGGDPQVRAAPPVPGDGSLGIGSLRPQVAQVDDDGDDDLF